MIKKLTEVVEVPTHCSGKVTIDSLKMLKLTKDFQVDKLLHSLWCISSNCFPVDLEMHYSKKHYLTYTNNLNEATAGTFEYENQSIKVYFIQSRPKRYRVTHNVASYYNFHTSCIGALMAQMRDTHRHTSSCYQWDFGSMKILLRLLKGKQPNNWTCLGLVNSWQIRKLKVTSSKSR
jgi:superoxide dismutase